MTTVATLRSFTFLVAGVVLSSLPAAAENKIFINPKIHGHSLDWCKVWGDKCGASAAQAFCWYMDQGKVLSYSQNPNPQLPTEVISSKQLCKDNGCAGFKKIVCAPHEGSGNLDNDVGMNPQGDENQDSGNDVAQQGGDGEPAQNGNYDGEGSQSNEGQPTASSVVKVHGLGGVVKSELSAVTFKQGGQPRVAVFGKGQDGKLWWQAGDGKGQWFGWEAVGTGVMSMSPSCANSSHGITCNYLGAGNYIWSVTYFGDHWGTPEKTDGIAPNTPAAASYLDEEGKSNIIVFVKDGLGRLVANWKNKDPDTDFWVWHGWTPTGAMVPGAPSCRQWGPTTATIYCATRNTNGATLVTKLQGATTGKSVNLGGVTSNRPQLVAGSLTPGVRLLVRGEDGKLWWRESKNGSWTGWKGTDIDIAKAPACAIQGGSATSWCFNINDGGSVTATGFNANAVFQ